MTKPKVSLNDYQNQTNVHGLITTNQISHSFRPEPCRNTHPVQTSIYDENPLELVLKNTPVPIHDNFVTTNNLFYGHKFLENEYIQPFHVKSPGLRQVHYIKPDFYRKVAQGGFNLNPIYNKSETHDEFRPKYHENDGCGSPSLYITHRDVFLPLNKDSVFYFNQDEPHVLIRMTHPYITTNQMTHRKFSSQELESQKTLDLLECSNSAKNCDVAIKSRVLPMTNPLEQAINLHPNLDQIRSYPSALYPIGQNRCFRRSLYNGCPPRVFQPVPHVGWLPTYTKEFNTNFSNQVTSNTIPTKFCYLQPKHSSKSAMRIPHMYTTENTMYGSGRNVSSYVKVSNQGICADTCTG